MSPETLILNRYSRWLRYFYYYDGGEFDKYNDYPIDCICDSCADCNDCNDYESNKTQCNISKYSYAPVLKYEYEDENNFDETLYNKVKESQNLDDKRLIVRYIALYIIETAKILKDIPDDKRTIERDKIKKQLKTLQNNKLKTVCVEIKKQLKMRRRAKTKEQKKLQEIDIKLTLAYCAYNKDTKKELCGNIKIFTPTLDDCSISFIYNPDLFETKEEAFEATLFEYSIFNDEMKFVNEHNLVYKDSNRHKEKIDDFEKRLKTTGAQYENFGGDIKLFYKIISKLPMPNPHTLAERIKLNQAWVEEHFISRFNMSAIRAKNITKAILDTSKLQLK